MNKETFYEYLRNPEILDESKIAELNDIIVEYPYFQVAHMLLTKNYHNINHIKYENQLKNTALYISNRTKLFNLINSTNKASDFSEKNKVEAKEIIEVSNNIQKTEKTELKIVSSVNRIQVDENENLIENEKVEINEIENARENDEIIIEKTNTNDSEKEVTIIDTIISIEPKSEIEAEELFIENAEMANDEANIKNSNNEINEEEFKSFVNVQNDILIENPQEGIKNYETIEEPIFEDVNEAENENVTESNNAVSDVAPIAEDKIILNKEPIIDSYKPSNIADEILERIAILRQSFDSEISENNESIADIILKKAAEARQKKEKQFEILQENITSSNEAEHEKENLDESISSQISSIENELDDISEIISTEEKNSSRKEYYEEEVYVEKETTLIDKKEIYHKPEIVQVQKIDLLEKSLEIEEEEKTEIIEIEELIIVEEEILDKKLDFNNWLQLLSSEKKSEENKNQTKEDISSLDLIDKFIKEEPRIIPKNISQEKQIEVKSTKNIDGSDTFITETLAKIYIKQGHFDKAINIYEKLSLKNSENSTYFAKKIEDLKNKIN